MTTALARWQSLPVSARCRLIAGLICFGIAVYLVFAPKPWSVPVPAAEPPPYDYFVKIYSWWGGVIALCGTMLLSATAPLWSRPWIIENNPILRPPAARWFWPLVAVAMLLTAAMGTMRLGHDLWDDERTTLQRYVQGNYKPNADDTVRFREFGFGRTLHEYRMPNNHVLHSVLARVSVGVWRIFRDPQAHPFSEPALRFPAFLFGIASVGALALLLKELGMPRAGVIAAFLLAIHPWHIRYASEARGYGLVLCLLPLLVVTLLRAMESGAWRWWIAFGALQFSLLYTYPAMLYTAVAANIVALIFIALHIPGTVPTGALFSRWIAPVTVAALVFTWLFLPCAPQLLAYLDSDLGQGSVGIWWMKDFLSHLFAGASWFKTHDPTAVQPELHSMLKSQGIAGSIVLWTAICLGALGTLRMLVRGSFSAATVVLLLLPALAAYLVAYTSGTYLYEWYLVYLLPGVVAMVATGFDTLGLPWKTKWLGWIAVAVPAAAFCAGYLTLTSKARTWLLEKPLQPMRESVLLTRPSTLPNYPGHSDVITASFNTPPYLYDPHVTVIRTPEELRALMRQCADSAVPLYLNVGNPPAAAFHHPEMFRLMNDPEKFEILKQLPGYDPTLDRIVARSKQPPAGGVQP